MGNILNVVIVVLLVGWLVGFFGFSEAVGSFIHILLVLAVISIIIRILT